MRVCPLDRAGVVSSGGLLPTESWVPCGCLYASGSSPSSLAQLWRLACLQKAAAKRYLRSTGADTRLSSNHGSNERSPLRRNFQPRRWRTAVLAMCSLAAQRRQKRGRGAPRPLLYAVAAPLVHGWLEKRSRLRAGGSSLEFRRSPAGPRGPVRGWRPAAAAALMARGRRHTHT